FTANQIDPIKFIFDKNILNQSDEEKIKSEITRKIDKTITNAIGDFHEDLLGKIKGYKKYLVGYGYDIKDDDNSLYVDIKNKNKKKNHINKKHEIKIQSSIKLKKPLKENISIKIGR